MFSQILNLQISEFRKIFKKFAFCFDLFLFENGNNKYLFLSKEPFFSRKKRNNKTCDECFPGVYRVTRFLEYTSDLLELSNVTWFFAVLDDVDDTWSLEMLDSRLRFIGVFRELRKRENCFDELNSNFAFCRSIWHLSKVHIFWVGRKIKKKNLPLSKWQII